eukprot:10986018-Alexandrium_andersonii.AAC.1
MDSTARLWVKQSATRPAGPRAVAASGHGLRGNLMGWPSHADPVPGGRLPELIRASSGGPSR